jgi:NAD(P)-dependent dehydrogenase (short-subunit alcohol dehydrogenase family)
MTIDLSGKQAIVTGGARGIGAAVVRVLRAAGATVHVFDLPEVDVTRRESIAAAMAKVPAPDIVIANAGVGVPEPPDVTAATAENWEKTIAVNLTGVFHTVQLAAEAMKPRRKGSIVITASTNSWDGEATLTAYNASKAGVLGIMRTAANELGRYGIRVNAVCPGLIRTPLTDWYFDHGDVLKPYFEHIALGRGGEPEEVAQAMVFLASDAASYITGTTLTVDGGQLTSKYSTWTDENAVFVKDHWEPKA